MNCTKCGAPLGPTDKFCSNCAAQIFAGTPVDSAAPAGIKPPIPGISVAKKKSPLLMIIAIILLVVSVAGFIYSCTDGVKIVGKWTANVNALQLHERMVYSGTATMDYTVSGQQTVTMNISENGESEQLHLTATSPYVIADGVITYGQETITGVTTNYGYVPSQDEMMYLYQNVAQARVILMPSGRLMGANNMAVNLGNQSVNFVRAGGLAYYAILMIASGVLAAIGILLLILGLKQKKGFISPLATVSAPTFSAAPNAPAAPVASAEESMDS